MKTIAALFLSLTLLSGVAACNKGEAAGGAAPTQGVKQWYCPMDKEVVSDKPGQSCPKCGMKLEPKPAK